MCSSTVKVLLILPTGHLKQARMGTHPEFLSSFFKLIEMVEVERYAESKSMMCKFKAL